LSLNFKFWEIWQLSVINFKIRFKMQDFQ